MYGYFDNFELLDCVALLMEVPVYLVTIDF